jgi:predicted CoA-binding protein
MATAGYSGTPLLKKLGIKPGAKLFLVNPPSNYFELLETDVAEQICETIDTADIIHLFVKNNKEFQSEMQKIFPVIKKNKNITVWVSWYKKSAGIATDVTEDTIRNFALKNGLVDVKVCAVSEIWSGLKLLVPLKLRNQ